MFKSTITKNMKLLVTIMLVVMLLGVLATTVYAQSQVDLFESQNYYTTSGPKDGVFSLTYVGQGCPAANDPDDYRFRINVTYSSIYKDWKFYSNNSKYQQLPTGRQFNGYRFDTTEPYICIGNREFWGWPFNGWVVAEVEQNVYVWRK